MNQLRTLYRNSRKNSLYGMKAKHMLHIIMFAVLMMAGIGAMCYASGGEGIGMVIAAAPLAGIIAPDLKNKIDLVEAMRGMTEVSDGQVKFLKAMYIDSHVFYVSSIQIRPDDSTVSDTQRP